MPLSEYVKNLVKQFKYIYILVLNQLQDDDQPYCVSTNQDVSSRID